MGIEGDAHCTNIVAAVKAQIEERRTQEFLRAVERRKMDAEPVEIALLEPLEDYLRAALEPEIGEDQDYKQQDAEDRERAYPRRPT